ncbi:MAG: hypothetical protein ACRDQ5_19390, partial [Sciscionella sp.]
MAAPSSPLANRRVATGYTQERLAEERYGARSSLLGDLTPVRRLALAYHEVADAWRVRSHDFAAPLWARHA